MQEPPSLPRATLEWLAEHGWELGIKMGTNKLVTSEIFRVVTEEGLNEAEWVLGLTELDEPPFYTRLEQMHFLESVPMAERGPAFMSVALSLLSGIRDTLVSNSGAIGAPVFACITVTDFAEWRSGELPVPTFALLVEPRGVGAPKATIPLALSRSEDGLQVQEWLVSSGHDNIDDFVVAELVGEIPSELKRVYVGHREGSPTSYISLQNEI